MMKRLSAAVMLAIVAASTPALAADWVDFPTAPGAGADRFERARSLETSGRIEAAIGEYAMAAEADPTSVTAFRKLSVLYAKLRRWTQSADAAQQAARLDPKDPATQAVWGHSLLRAGKYAESIWVLEGLVRLNAGGDLRWAYYDLASACYAMRWYDRAVEYAGKHLGAGESAQGQALLARAYLALGQKDKANAALARSVTLYDPQDDARRMGEAPRWP